MNYRRTIKKIISFFCCLFPIQKDKAVFDNFNGRGYGDNPKYIAEAFLRMPEKYRLIWLVTDINEPIPEGIEKVRFGSLKSIYHLSTAKFIFNNVRNDLGFIKRKRQLYVQTWHASMGLKKIEKDTVESLSEGYIQDAIHDGKITDLMVTNNSFYYDLMQKSFWYSGKVLFCGLPRNDILINGMDVNKVYDYFAISKEKKIILYAPTFRDEKYDYSFDYEKVLTAFEGKFGEDFVLLLRLHPNVSSEAVLKEETAKVKNAGKYDDIQELLYVADILITDFSSVFFDFVMMKKKVFIYAEDYDHYIQKERNLYFDYSTLDFAVSKSQDELCQQIINFDSNQYQERLRKIDDVIEFRDSGRASEKVISYVVNQ